MQQLVAHAATRDPARLHLDADAVPPAVREQITRDLEFHPGYDPATPVVWHNPGDGSDTVVAGADTLHAAVGSGPIGVLIYTPPHLWSCGCLINEAGHAHRVGCPDFPAGRRG